MTQQPSDALEASGHSVTGLDVETPATAPSMSPDTVPSEAFQADASLCLSQISCDNAQRSAAAGADAEEEAAAAAYARDAAHRDLLAEEEEGEGEGGGPREYDDVRLYADEEDDCAAPPPPPAGGVSPPQGGGGAGEEDVVGATVHALCDDAVPRLVLSESCGWSSGVVLDHVLPQLEHTRNTVEVVLVDMHDDALIHGVCATIAGTPSIHALTLVNSGRAPGLGLRGIACVAHLVSCCGHLHALSIMNGLFGHTGPAMKLLGDAVAQSRSLRALNLEANGIDDESLLPLAQALAGQKSILEANLDSNSLSYQGLDILSEVMMYNETLQHMSLKGNLLRCVTDVWEGYFVYEQCMVNREMARLGAYTRAHHAHWPQLWRRKMKKLWHSAVKADQVAEAEGAERCPAGLGSWERVFQFLDPRGYVEQHVKLWMKLSPTPQPPPQILRQM